MTVKDKLALLQAVRNDEEDFQCQVDNPTAVDIDPSDGDLNELFSQVENIRTMIEAIATDVDHVKRKHSDILSAPTSDEKSRQELEDLTAAIKSTSSGVNANLKLIQVDEEGQGKEFLSPAYLRIRKTQHAALSREFVQVMTEYNGAQASYRDRCKERIQRQLEITGKNTTDEELEDMIAQGNVTLFTQGIISESLEDHKKTLADIETRHADIMKLENSIRELHDMFVDMAFLVQNQGDMIDHIENHVSQTKDYVATGRKRLKSAHIMEKKVRKKKIILGIIAVVVIGILILILLI